MNGVPYTADQIAYLRRAYARTPIDELLKVLHPHTLESIQKFANDNGWRRRRITRRPKYPIIDQLREAREALGLTRVKLCRKLDYHVIMFGRWERGDANPSIERLHKWAAAVGMKIVAQVENGASR